MSPKFLISTIIFLSMFVFAEFATAELIRNGGRATLSLQTEIPYYFVENEDVIQIDGDFGATGNFGIVTGMSESAFNNINSGFGITTNTIGGGSAGISAVPSFSGAAGSSADDNCNGSYTPSDAQDIQDDIDFLISSGASANAIAAEEARLTALENGTPCEWQITEGDNLTAFGTFSMFFDNPLINTSIQWNISGNGVNKTLTGGVNTDPNRTTPDGDIGVGNVFLDALWDDLELLPGTYNISVSASISSNAGMFFKEQKNLSSQRLVTPRNLERADGINPEHDAWIVRQQAADAAGLPFTEPEPIQFVTGYVMADENFNDYRPTNSLFFSSTSSLLTNFPPETLRVVARANQPPPPPTAANAPASGIFVLVASIMLCLRKRTLKAK